MEPDTIVDNIEMMAPLLKNTMSTTSPIPTSSTTTTSTAAADSNASTTQPSTPITAKTLLTNATLAMSYENNEYTDSTLSLQPIGGTTTSNSPTPITDEPHLSITPPTPTTPLIQSADGPPSPLSTSHPTSSRQLYKEAAAAHGATETTSLLQHELSHIAAMQQVQRLRSASSTLDTATVSRNPSTVGGKHEKKIGHRRVDEGGEVTYKKIQSKQIMGSIQLGIQHTVGSLASKPKRDLLMNDFWEMETISFPPDGSTITPAHHYSDFRFKVYAPIAFRYFRDLFGIAPDDFLISMCASPLRELSNPGASGSIFYLTDDDEFIIKTVQKKECEFLQKLLPGYYMNLSQNPRTLLPKFFGLYCFHYNSKNVRLVAMNNLLPSDIKMHAKYDLKGSTFRRKASKAERQKASPTFKDLDFMDHHPNGIFLETDKYNALIRTIQRDCMVLESFQIMDYSLLVGIHNLDIAAKEKREERIRNARAKLQRHEDVDDAPEADQVQNLNHLPAPLVVSSTSSAAGTALNRSRSINRQRLVAHSTALESITADLDTTMEEDDDVPAGGIPARSENDERLILFIGIIDILQSYRLEKKLEHTFKSILYNGDTVSVCRPSFYSQRFQNFMGKTVFKKTPTFPLKHSPSKRKTSTATMRTPQRTPSQSISLSRPNTHTMLSGMSTPPPAFDDISEEDLTANSSAATSQRFSVHTRNPAGSVSISAISQPPPAPRSYVSSNRSVMSSDYSDDESASNSGVRSPHRTPKLTKTSVQLTTVGCVEDAYHNDGDDDDNNDINDEHITKVGGVKLVLAADGDRRPAAIAVQSKEQNYNLHVERLDANGKPIVSTTKTTLIQANSQTYTSTLVVNDVQHL